MPVPFGFSVGDFVSVLNLFKEVGAALKEHGGASDDYQKTLQLLTAVHLVVLQLENFKSSTGSLTQINAIRCQAHLIQHEVERFLKNIEKYKDTLGARSRKSFHHGILPKITWSQHVVAQVEKLRTRVETQLLDIHVLLGLHHNNAISWIYDGLLKLQDDVKQISAGRSSLLKDCELEAGRIQLSIQQAASCTQNHIITCSDNLIDRMNDLETSLKDILVSSSSNQTNITMNVANTQARVNQLERNHIGIIRGMQQCTATASNLAELKNMLALYLRNTRRTQESNNNPNETAPITLTLALPRLDITTRDLQVLLHHLSAKFEIELRLFFALFFLCLKDLVLALPQIIMIYRILQRLPQAISLTLHNNMTFEDALGRVQSLQYQQFKHWTVFEESLRCTFVDMPGMKKVLDGHFVLTTPAPVRTLSASNWMQLVKPGLEIHMSIIIKTIATAVGKCPRGCSYTKDSKSPNGEICCSQCGLLFSKSSEAIDNGFKPTIAEQRSEGLTSVIVTADSHSAEDLASDALASGVKEASVLAYGPIHYDQWFQDHRVESEEIKVMKRIHLDYTEADPLGPWRHPGEHGVNSWEDLSGELPHILDQDDQTEPARKMAMLSIEETFQDAPNAVDRHGDEDHPLSRIVSGLAGPLPTLHDDRMTANRGILGTSGSEEKLDHRYRMRSDARRFFVLGRIFALLWHQSAGGSAHTEPCKANAITADHGFCLCLPIHTYSGQGVTKPGLSESDRRAHAIVYMTDTRPFCRPEEKRYLTKKPIAVNKASADQRLDPMSRLNFKKIYSINHNVKVMNIGKVDRGMVPALVGYWRQSLQD